ncbi:MAG: hypothetical protein ABSB58_00640 [Gemmatimonadales bacterium]
MRSVAVILAFLAVSCAPPNLRPEWIRTAGSAYGCPRETLARADTARGFWGQDPRTLAVGTGVCDLVVRTSMPSRVVPDRTVVGAVRETWFYALPADAAGTHTAVVTLEGLMRNEMAITAVQDVTTPAAAPQAESGGRRRRG